ncbi:MAG: alpha/beta fold hydrolase [Methanospirillaceae archaeon]|nr:alpha/beta fold hydrolase [Methanospirillaceae archaeon]
MAEENRQGFVTVEGRKIWFVMDGCTKPETPLLILHGGPGCTHDYLTSLVPLSDERPVIWYDQLGCGNSEKLPEPSGYTLEYYTRELGAIRKELGLDDVHILGQSWGTMPAVEYMLSKNPTGVRSLVLSAPCLSASRWHADQRRYLSDLPADIKETIIQARQKEGMIPKNTRMQ